MNQQPAGPYSIGSDHWPGLSKLIEECGEVLQTVGKLVATNGAADHWDGSDLYRRLGEELGDLMAAIDFVIEQNEFFGAAQIGRRAAEKLEVFRAWHRAQAKESPPCV